MRRFASSKLCIVLSAGVLAIGLLAVSHAFGQAAPAPAPAAAPAPVMAAPAAPSAVVAGHKEGLMSLILNNIDIVFIIIAICSVAGLTFIIQGFIKCRASVMMPEASTNHIRELINQRQFKELIEFTENDPSFISRAINPALKRAPSFSSMKEAMETAIGEQTAEAFRGIEYLNIIGNLGPLLGLLGTVLGMIDAFSAMHAAGGAASPAELSYGISKALCHTFLGLFLAIPCLAAFGILRTMVDRLTVSGALVCEELLLMVKPADAKPAPARPGSTPQPARKSPVPMPPLVPAQA